MGEIKLDPYSIHSSIDYISEIPRGVFLINAPALWHRGITGKGVVVAVLDSGCHVNHPELTERIIGGRNFTDDYNADPTNFNDNLHHGTHVAGIIAASQNNSGVVGVAPESDLLILKVISMDGSGSYRDLIRAIFYAIEWRGPNNEKVRIMTMSLGGSEPDPMLHYAIKLAIQHNILVVTSSGNYGDGDLSTNEILYPAYYPEVVAVGAIDQKIGIATFSNTNDQVDLYAPGTHILSTVPNNQFAELSGTSMAAPHVAGAAALLLNKLENSLSRTITEEELFNELMKNTITMEPGVKLLSL